MEESVLDAIVIGAGITGIGSAYYLGENQLSYQVFEKSNDVGGIWHTQRWHGCRCDSAFVKYSFSFEPALPETDLTDKKTIQNYLRQVTKDCRIYNHIKFGTEVLKAEFHSTKSLWSVHTTKGVYQARFLINGNGYFSEPHIPDFKEKERFQGEIIHSFHLDSKQNFYKKNVVLVGSGATAIACAPALSEVSKSLVLLQRSPSYIYEIDNTIGWHRKICQNLYKKGIQFPLSFLRYCIQLKDDLIFVFFRSFPKFGRWFFKRHWLPIVGEKMYEEHFHPKYNPWEQRIPVAIGLKQKIVSGKIQFVTDQIDQFNPHSILLKSGKSLDCDVCILATGFDLNFFKFDIFLDGEKQIMERRNYFKTILVGGIPNYFHPAGVWHSAWTPKIEQSLKYGMKIIDHMKKNNYSRFQIPKKIIEGFSPSISPNYIKRHGSRFCPSYGTLELPSIDKIFFYSFNPKDIQFS